MKSFEFKESPVHGSGIFTKEDISQGTRLFDTHVLPEKSLFWINLKPNCMYNHSQINANCLSVTDSGKKYLLTAKDIKQDEELLVNYTKDEDLEQPRLGWVDCSGLHHDD